jgi:hypothetical protein
MAIDPRDGGVCLAGATVEVLRGEGVGRRFTQDTPCNVWGYGGGFSLTDLTPGVELTLRFSASGYEAKDVTFIPVGSAGQVAVVELSKK